ncbi:MAG: hypothetical protein ACXV7J_03205 [Methylomonas sp.]
MIRLITGLGKPYPRQGPVAEATAFVDALLQQGHQWALIRLGPWNVVRAIDGMGIAVSACCLQICSNRIARLLNRGFNR